MLMGTLQLRRRKHKFDFGLESVENTPKMKLRVTRKYHSHTLQTNPWNREEEPQNNNIHKTLARRTNKVKQPAISFPFEMIAKLERIKAVHNKT